ncbi:MAG: zf-HC2 domain-containing protein [Candidatus Kapaibacterium sp.]|nr:MAG: zf-HC2 domain-containing protein [Candidatus Kapabacteria bacterium]
MTNDELLALYLDNTLSEAERQEFEVRLQGSPELMQEMKELHAIQNMLFTPAKDDALSFAFLRSVENNIAASILASGAAATGAVVSAASLKTGASAVASVAAQTAVSTGGTSIGGMWASAVASVSSSLVGASLAAASVIGSGVAVYYAVSPSVAEKAAPQQTPAQRPQPLPEKQQHIVQEQQLPPSPTASSAASATSPVEKSRIVSNTAEAENTAHEAPHSAEYSARISGGTSIQGRFAASIQEYRRQLQEKETTGDRIGAALVEKSLASVLREAAQFSESRRYGQKALKAAQQLGMKELEGDLYGEQGLLLLAEGKSTQAEEALRNAVDILTSQQSRNAARWQRELEKLTNK